jgi:hypothetical protein
MAHPFFTIGHATRSIEELVGLLQDSAVTFVADVRTQCLAIILRVGVEASLGSMR